MWIGLFIAFIMVFSIFGFIIDFAVQPSAKGAKYGDFKFRVVNQQYVTKINGVEHVFFFFPRDLEYILLSGEVKALLDKPVLIVTYDPKSNLSENFAESQYYFESQLADGKTIERALTNNEGTQLSQKSCSDATESQPVIELRKGEKSGVSAVGNCIQLSAVDAFDLYQQTERLIYTIFGVMQ